MDWGCSAAGAAVGCSGAGAGHRPGATAGGVIGAFVGEAIHKGGDETPP